MSEKHDDYWTFPKTGVPMSEKLENNTLDNPDDEEGFHYIFSFDEEKVLDFYKKSLDDLKWCLDGGYITDEQYLDGVKDINWCVRDIFKKEVNL